MSFEEKERLKDLVGFIDIPSSGITFCTGSLDSNEANNLPKMVEYLEKRFIFYI